MPWIERTNLDRAKTVAFLMEGAAASPVTKVVSARMAANDFAPNFFLKLMAKVIYRLWQDDNKDLMILPASLPLYDGSSVARKGLVFVSFNYRLGRFGFFAHPALSNAGEGRLGDWPFMSPASPTGAGLGAEAG